MTSVSQDTMNYRAILRGAVTDVGGSLFTSTLVEIAAITGMLARGEMPDAVVRELPQSLALALFVAAGGIVMSVCGGYVAATFAGTAQLKHALLSGLLATILNGAVNWAVGASGPLWLTTATLACVTPCAVLGGWLAMPVATPHALPAEARR
jgi:hypothetical protein